MRTLLRAALIVTVTMIAGGACAKSASTGTKVTCGTGTHDDGAGTCQLDNALAVDNSVGNNYWSCPEVPGSSIRVYLSIASGGTAKLGTNVSSVGGGSPTYQLTWQEGSATDEITVSTNPLFDTLEQIAPSAAVGAQSFTSKAYKSGVLVYNLTCQLTLGTF